MPVILDPKDFDAWLDPEVHEPEEITKAAAAVPAGFAGLLRSLDAGELTPEQPGGSDGAA